jgi:hypothetical protein
MKLSQLITANAILFIASGIAFVLNGPIMMAYFSVPARVEIDVLEYWQIAAFASMFGAALFGYGLLLWSLRGAIDQIPLGTRRGVVFAQLLACALAAFVSFTQSASFWGSAAGWIASAIYILLTIAYGAFLFAVSRADKP